MLKPVFLQNQACLLLKAMLNCLPWSINRQLNKFSRLTVFLSIRCVQLSLVYAGAVFLATYHGCRFHAKMLFENRPFETESRSHSNNLDMHRSLSFASDTHRVQNFVNKNRCSFCKLGFSHFIQRMNKVGLSVGSNSLAQAKIWVWLPGWGAA